jgi:hypothetical protein
MMHPWVWARNDGSSRKVSVRLAAVLWRGSSLGIFKMPPCSALGRNRGNRRPASHPCHATLLFELSQIWDTPIMEADSTKDVVWVASSLDDLKKFPESVRQFMGFAIYQAQYGGKHVDAKPLKGYKGSGVLEVVEDFDGDEQIHESRALRKEGTQDGR